MASPAFRINGGAPGVKASVSASGSVTATLDSTDGVRRVEWSVIGTDETTEITDYTLTPSGSIGQTVTLTAGAAGTAGILRCQINGGLNAQEQPDSATRATAKWYVLTAGGAEVGCVNETYESNATYGWTGLVNAALRTAGVTVPTFTSIPYRGYLAKATDGSDGATQAERIVFTGAPVDIDSAIVQFWPDSTLTASDADYATFTVRVRDPDGSLISTATAVTTRITGGTGDWQSFLAVIVGASLSVDAGNTVTVQIGKTGSGVPVPSGQFEFYGVGTP